MLDANPTCGNSLVPSIWAPPAWKVQGAWFWWFWLFFIHDENTQKTGKCRQLMILWSVKKDRKIACNGMDIEMPVQIEEKGDKKWQLNGAAAAWYFDGGKMQENFVLEKSQMQLDGNALSLSAPGSTPSSYSLEGKDHVVRIKAAGSEFEFRARQIDFHKPVGPNYGRSLFPFGMEIEGTRIENLHLSGFEKKDGKQSQIRGTAYFQKILVAAPPPQWYWGLYHFEDGSFFTYMLPYVGRAVLAGKGDGAPALKQPSVPLQQDITLYHAPTGRVFEGRSLRVIPKKIGGGLFEHGIFGKGKDFEITAIARAYAHSCWQFDKQVGVLPFKSAFRYNEYPSVLETLVLKTSAGEEIRLKNGWGNMENSWGFLI